MLTLIPYRDIDRELTVWSLSPMSKASEKKDWIVPEHSHCMVCSRPVQSSKWFCSDECEMKYNALMKKRKTRYYLSMSAAFLPIVIIVLYFVFIGR